MISKQGNVQSTVDLSSESNKVQQSINSTQSKKKYSYKPECIFSGGGLIKNYISSQVIKQIRENNIKFVRIEYKPKRMTQMNKDNHKKVIVSIIKFPQNQIQSEIRQEVSIDNTREKFFIGSQDNQLLNLIVENYQIQAEIIFNDIYLNDITVAPMHLEVIYGHLNKKIITWIQEFQKLKNFFKNQLINLSDQSIEKILMFRQKRNKKKLKIADSARDQYQPILIQITINCENQILQENQTFTIGLNSQLIVKKIFYKLEHFFLKHSTKRNVSKVEQVFVALQSLKAIVQFSGIDFGLAELFELVQERNITLYDFNQRLLDDNWMLFNKLQSVLEKNCILLNVQRDQNQIEKFMLVADQKSKFTIGRMEQSDISFSSTQVSRSHGQISYLKDQHQWIIQDGMLNNYDEWQYSKFGTWLEMNIHQEYYIDSGQSVKIGRDQNLKFNIKYEQNDLNDFDNSEEYEKYQTQKQQDIDNLVEQLLNF